MRQRLRAIAARYGSAARSYRQFWAPVMVTHSRPLIEVLPLAAGDVVADLGCGVGAIGARLAPRAGAVVGLDVAEGMLRRSPRDVLTVTADIVELPFGDRTLNGAYSTFALQHVRRTGEVFRQVARALAPGGFLGTATWGKDHAEAGGVYDVLDELFARHRIPPEAPVLKTWHGNVDEPAKLERHARAAGLTVERAWAARSTYAWPKAGFIGWATMMGPYGRRLAAAPDVVRARVIEDLHNDLAPLPPSAFRWTPECVYLIALKG
jgi:ubiquinone/menaquinone biosynthesis C-methylase UbiE